MRTLLLAMALAAGPAAACEGLQADQGWLREAPPGARVMAGYLRLHNGGRNTVTVRIGEAPDFHHAMLHRTVIEGGRASMQHLDALSLAPGQTAVLEPGGMHLMLHGPRRILQAGDKSLVVLECGDGSLAVQLPVRRPQARTER